MNVHSNARLTPRSRALLVRVILEEGLTVKQAAGRFSVSERTAAKWLARYRKEGTGGLADRSSAPGRRPRRTPPAQVAVVLSLRRMRLSGVRIARLTGLSKATVSRLLAAHPAQCASQLPPGP